MYFSRQFLLNTRSASRIDFSGRSTRRGVTESCGLESCWISDNFRALCSYIYTHCTCIRCVCNVRVYYPMHDLFLTIVCLGQKSVAYSLQRIVCSRTKSRQHKNNLSSHSITGAGSRIFEFEKGVEDSQLTTPMSSSIPCLRPRHPNFLWQDFLCFDSQAL